MVDSLKINEIFYSIQGESTFAGEPCAFVRLAYCDLRCTYCDTEYAFHDGRDMSFTDILNEIGKFNCNLVEVTGGEPLLQKNVLPFMTILCDDGYQVLLETSGHVDISVVDERVVRIMDIKCPGSGESGKVLWDNIKHLSVIDQVKFVISHREDYEWARNMVNKYDLKSCNAVLFSPVFGKMDNRRLAEWILEGRLPVRFHIQMHKYIWEANRRGV